MKNILVVGVGPHARRSHLPALATGQRTGLVGTVHGVDVRGVMDAVVPYTAHDGPRSLPVTLIEGFDPGTRALPRAVRATLDALVVRLGIDAVVVSTEPAHHMAYTRWALDRGLSVLLDKPLSVHAHASTDPGRAAAVLDDFDDVLARYRQARRLHPDLIVSVQCQRRYHPAFWRMRQLIAEVARETGCPVTSVQTSHCDGQWRLPDELLDLTYHGYNRGYGKCAHSGYHFFDIVPWLLTAAERPGKNLDAVTVHAHIARPGDVLAQLTADDHDRLLPGFATRNPYTADELLRATAGFGEVDAFLSLAFSGGGRTMTLAGINLLHTGFSQRGNLTPAHSLYTGNGRVRQETHIIQQGPFQAIHFHSLQTLARPHDPGADPHTGGGGADNVEIHVLRNDRLRPHWAAHTRLDHRALTGTWNGRTAAPTQQSSRRRAVEEFLEYLHGRRTRRQMRSDLTDHRRSATLMAGAYLSMARRWTGDTPETTLDFRTQAEPAAARRRAEAAL